VFLTALCCLFLDKNNNTIKKISWGIVGCGSHARKSLIPALKNCPNSQILAFASSSIKTREELAKLEPHTHILSDYYELFKIDEIDAVLISTSNDLHPELTSMALNMGKHVLCEKPLAWTEKDINLIALSLARSSCLLATGFMYRMHPQIEYLKQSMLSQRPIELIARFHYPQLNVKNIRTEKDLGGGALLDIGCYLLDVSRFLFEKDPIKMHFSNQISQKNGCDEKGRITLVYDNAEAYLSYSQYLPRDQQIQLWTSSSGFTLSSPFLVPRNKHVNVLKTTIEGKASQVSIPPANSFELQFELFSKSIISGSLLPPLSTGLENAKDLSYFYQKLA
jgi:predicted dehydrogenase